MSKIMTKISAVVITKNEELNIRRCLESLTPVVEEIIVVDSLSTDKTRDICLSFTNVKFIETEWKGFSATKNFANSHAKFDFILSMDADEELSRELQKKILELKNNISFDQAYYFNRITNYCGTWIHHSGWYPDYQLRLFPKNGSQWNGAQVHEHIEFSKPLKLIYLKENINHYSYYTINDHIDRMKSYTSLGAEKVLSKNESFLLLKAVINPWFRFVKTYFLKRGFLDGTYGFALSIMASFTVFLKYFKAWQAKKLQKKL